MRRPLYLILCASTAALIMGAPPIGVFTAPAQAQVGVAITASIAPPLLPVYAQPPIPGPGYVWIPGYWAWDGQEYYWVPGYWATPPNIGLLWTPGYWGWNDADNDYVFYAGYWGPTVGYYGGIDYGYGYTGDGYQGGYWQNNTFVYNSAVNNFGAVRIANVFNRPVAESRSNISFNGGKGGTTAKPTEAQLAAARERHVAPTAAQVQHQQAASRDPALRLTANHGRPTITAVQRAGELHAGAAAAAGNAAAATRVPPERPRVGTLAPTVRPQVATHAPAMNAPGMRQRFAVHAPAMHAPAVMRQRFATHAPAIRAPAMPQRFVTHAPMMRAPAMHAPATHMQTMRAPPIRMGGGPQMGVMRIGGGGIQMGGPHIGGGGGPHIGGGGGGGKPAVGGKHIP